MPGFDLQMMETARALVARGKGILAADESLGTIAKRFQTIQLESSEENRRAYRELLFNAKGLEQAISGVILFDETLRQKGSDGKPLIAALCRRNIVPGIKVDKGAKALAGCPGERITEGLDGLRERLVEYRELGARFTKWRAVIAIGRRIPTDLCLRSNAHALARYAALSQEAGLVPVVEPEVLMDGAHDIEKHGAVTQRALELVFAALAEHRIRLECMLLKPNMVLSGTECDAQAKVAQVAEWTVRCMKRAVPAAVPGLVFLSGGQSDKLATAHLNAMNQRGAAPWELSFSFGRALQSPALQAWAGNPSRAAAAQRALVHRARCNGAARSGQYTRALETA